MTTILFVFTFQRFQKKPGKKVMEKCAPPEKYFLTGLKFHKIELGFVRECIDIHLKGHENKRRIERKKQKKRKSKNVSRF